MKIFYMINLDPLKTKKKKMISIFTIVTSVLLLSFSSSPPLGKTGAPGEGLCSECHSSVPIFNGTLAIHGVPATVLPETTYPISIVIIRDDATPLKAGFQLVALNGNNFNIGTLGNGGSNVGFASSGIRNYAQHQNAKSFVVDNDTITYTFDWTAPAIAGSNTITFYAASVLANGNGSSFNDRVLTHTATTEFIGPQGDPLEVIIANVENVDCSGSSTGSATAIATGGISPYVYNWSNGGSTAELSGVPAGTYTVTVSDQLGESTSASVTITQPGAIQLQEVFSEDITCANPEAQINVTATGGTGTFDYSWSNGASGNEIMVNTGGNYTVTATDDNDCTATLTIFILANNQPPVISGGADQTIFCAGESVQLQGSGPIDPEITIDWFTINGNIVSGADSYTPTVSQAGEYYLLVFDDFTGCSSVDTVAVFGEPTPVVANGTVTNVSCNGGNTGSISLSPTGGGGGYTFQWSNGSTNQFLANVPAGTYAITVSDAFGCTGTSSYTITQPTVLTLSTSSTPMTGAGANDATITATAAGGTSPYNYTWSNASTGPTISNLGAGTYTVTATDNAGCTATQTVIISPFNCNLQIDHIDVEHQTCPGIADASIQVFLSGGTSPFTYNWSGGQQGNLLQDILPGIYMLTVLDVQGCAAMDTITVNASNLTLNVTGQNPSEPGINDGSATAIATGGSAPYNYLWSTGAITASITGLAAGTYSLTLTDENGCELTGSVLLSDGGCSLELEITSSTNESCDGLGDGSISVVASGGTEPYSYIWSNSDTTNTITGLSAGIYIVTATDDEGCTVVDTIEIGLDFYFELDVTPVSVEGEDDGSISVNVVGGIDPVTYLWSNGATTSIISNLPEGVYSVTVTNGDGCSGTATVTVGVVSCDLEIELVVQDSINCFGSTGFLALNFLTGGSAPYTYNYSWTPGIIGSQYEVLAGIFSVTVVDARGCSSEDTVEITQPDAITYEIVAFTPQISAEGTGTIHIDIAGGTGDYIIEWMKDGAPFNQNSDEITGLNTGVYIAEITDENGCVTITEPFEILLGTSTQEAVNQFPFTMYPNPVHEELVINGDWSRANSILVSDLSGRKINFQNTDNTQSIQKVRVNQLPAGLYILSINTDQGIYNSRFIKQ
jgi:hypothetical protein